MFPEEALVRDRNTCFIERDSFSCHPGNSFGERVGACFYNGISCMIVREDFLHGSNVDYFTSFR